jgi:hypothetical protein
MTDAAAGQNISEHNPFSTRFVRPGAIEYLFPHDLSAEALIDKLRGHAWQGEIVGPHGAGKSTLLATLVPHLIDAERNVVQVALHAGEKALPAPLDGWKTWTPETLVIVDGYEQLSWWSRSKLARRVKERGAGLLVTSHAPTGLPTLLQVAPRIEAAEQVVRQLVPDEQLINGDDIRQAYDACGGNIRETLFRLYDLYETRTR